MCDVIARAVLEAQAQDGSSRRRFLKVMGATAVGSLAAGTGIADAAPERTDVGGRTRLVLLGTAGGPTVLDHRRSGTSTAVVHQDRVYVVDLGMGAYQRLAQAGLPPGVDEGNMLGNVRGLFFTHLHSDHVTDWPAMYSTGMSNSIGRTTPPIEVWGPGDRSTLPRVFPPGRPQPPVVNPGDPTPGLVGMTGYLRQAFATDLNDRARDSALAGPDSLFRLHDIDLTGIWSPDPGGRPPRLSSPIHLWRDGDVEITATLVDHHPTAPAFAYRFDTPDGSIVVSGDTTVSENLIDLARDADYLVHEVIDVRFVERIVSVLPPETANALREHLLSSHTTIEQVGAQVAEPAGVKTLVLTHLVPANNPVTRWRAAQRGYSGRLVVGTDLQSLNVHPS
ncbi:MBL fold metallo-hydrolase [Amycolatopsis regifaucium]|uniref:Hydrolase n=1 Tax=Amycolatopsis regifaucium TaxID=546365 RepID=A0A154MWB5_9PSEU|nr:MBL fold metallo-hydrolase [Amycolatopsis regifaucium]KZB88290.1 hydrolase [Amycolatopsis regifaucium]OKA11402.1 hydrolase [Amycolatopsis regifaucium]SFH42737.1 Ribonuclease BN, tRNA processing enzyme [Amycolatopsis regifaucium]